MVTDLSAEDYNAFVKLDNYVAQLLLTHAFLIEYVVGAVALGQLLDKFPFRKKIAVSWIKHTSEKLPPRLKKHIDWPLKFGHSLLQNATYTSVEDSQSNS